jgi:hypothetical protein
MKAFVVHIDPEVKVNPAVARIDLTEAENQKWKNEEILDYAFRWTNNIEGSWSKDGNSDSNPDVTFLGKYFVDKEGFEYGARSTMVGDLIIIQLTSYESSELWWVVYRVGMVGFDFVATHHAKGWKDVDKLVANEEGEVAVSSGTAYEGCAVAVSSAKES